MEKPHAAAVLLRNLITAAIIMLNKFPLRFAGKYKLLENLRALLINCFLFFLRLLPSFSSSANPDFCRYADENFELKRKKHEIRSVASAAGVGGGIGDSGIARALSQLLSIMGDVPVSSRKYEAVRLLAEKLIDENRRENSIALREVNRTVLSAAFSRAIQRLEAAEWRNRGEKAKPGRYWLNRVVRAGLSAVGDGMWSQIGWSGEEMDQSAVPAEKLAAELIWLAEKMADCGFGEEAVARWASASKLAWLALSGESPLQCSLVRLSALLFKQAKELSPEEKEESKEEQQRQTKKKMLLSWLPLLCRASNGTDSPVLSTKERSELQKSLEDTIETLDKDAQEQVLSLWLHHFAHSSSSDWPNLHASYARWCSVSRKLMLLQ